MSMFKYIRLECVFALEEEIERRILNQNLCHPVFSVVTYNKMTQQTL